jgi:putative ABC transport system permease protein
LVNKLVLENLKFRPVRTGLGIVAIALEVTLMLTIVGLSRGMLAEAEQRARGVGADIIIRPRGSSLLTVSSATIDQRLVEWLEKQPHVTMAMGTIIQPLRGVDTITGIHLDRFNRMSGGFQFIRGGPFQGPDDVIVDRYFAQQNQAAVGSRIELLNRRWRVAGIHEGGKLARLVVPMNRLQELTANTGKVSQLYVKVDNPGNVQAVIDHLKTGGLEGYPIYSMAELASYYTVDKTPGLAAFINVVVGLSIVIGFLVVFLSMYTSVLERTREIGILKALGASPPFILGLLVRETAMLAILGSMLGIALSFGSRWLISVLVPASLTQHVVPSWWPIAGAIALSGALLGAAYPGFRAARQDPIEALSYE